jgi:hypothetical protein
MLKRAAALGRGAFALALTLAIWVPLWIALASSQNAFPTRLSIFDVQVALSLGAAFMTLSGYVVTVLVAYALIYDGQRWRLRAAVVASLFALHVLIFWRLVATDVPTRVDLAFIIVSLIGVLVAEAASGLLWGRRKLTA